MTGGKLTLGAVPARPEERERETTAQAETMRTNTPHWLRHFFASAGLSKRVPVMDMAEGSRETELSLPLEFEAVVQAA
ncbi:hypothetical protein [Streptomyces virginiae]